MTQNKVYVVIPYYEYEGYDEPIDVFSNKQKAEDAASKYNKEGGFNIYEVLEVDYDTE